MILIKVKGVSKYAISICHQGHTNLREQTEASSDHWVEPLGYLSETIRFYTVYNILRSLAHRKNNQIIMIWTSPKYAAILNAKSIKSIFTMQKSPYNIDRLNSGRRNLHNFFSLSLVSSEMIFEALQSELSRFKFDTLSSKILKIPEFNLNIDTILYSTDFW